MIRPFGHVLFPPRICVSVRGPWADAETGPSAFAELEVPNPFRTG